MPENSQYLSRFVINKDARKPLTEQLRKYGFDYAQLFPEIGYLGEEIREEGY